MNKKNINSFLIVGRIGSPYGIKGFIKIFSYTEKKENIFKYFPWFIKPKFFEKILVICFKKIKNNFLVKFKNFSDREKIKILTNENIWINKSQLPVLKKNEYYWNQMIGISVFNLKKEKIGKIINLIDNNFYDILIIEDISRSFKPTLFIPFIEDKIIKEVNIMKNYVLVDWDYHV
ncbi:ribosome maturation factor RimM [Buchnera aphidicola (Mindarus keteleerifoliae)]|uniref:ribosome maturation factor RimM n=1 Tax=Buchnera aphidicola TaxID=9 RepID=UPI0031B731F8